MWVQRMKDSNQTIKSPEDRGWTERTKWARRQEYEEWAFSLKGISWLQQNLIISDRVATGAGDHKLWWWECKALRLDSLFRDSGKIHLHVKKLWKTIRNNRVQDHHVSPVLTLGHAELGGGKRTSRWLYDFLNDPEFPWKYSNKVLRLDWQNAENC